MPESDVTSLSALARRLGVDEAAVRKAVKSGRLGGAVRRNGKGRPKVVDVALAERLWRENAGRRPRNKPDPEAPVTLVEAQRLQSIERTRALKLANDQKSGRLIMAVEAERRFSGIVIAAKSKLLGLPSRAKQRLPHLTVADVTELERLIREALEELAVPPATWRRGEPTR